jgi:tripartite-type tricarboxylate transporter receptor subunit TctC
MKIDVTKLTLIAFVSALPAMASAQDYPAKSIRMLVGFAPGGGTDIIGRIVAQKLSEALGQQVLVDNRGGAAGQIAAEVIAKAAPDGYTIMMAHIAAVSVLPSLVPKLPYDPLRDFATISLVATGPNLLVVHPSLPVKSVKDLVALAKARPGQMRYASSGAGSIQHLAAELFKLQSGVDMLHVPYKGSGQALIDLIAGHVDMNFDSVPPVINHVRQGKLRAIAITAAQRSPLLPDVATIKEGGVPGVEVNTWWGLVAPSAVGKDAIARLHNETIRLLRLNDVKEKIANIGAEPVGNTPSEFSAFIRAETAKYAKIVKAANIKLE